MIFVRNAKLRKTLWDDLPKRALIISGNVWDIGDFLFSSIASMAKSTTWIDAPAAYQNGPLTPYWYATVDDCSNVAAHVHADTTDVTIRPVFTVRPAVENHSNVFFVPSHFVSAFTKISTTEAISIPTPIRTR